MKRILFSPLFNYPSNFFTGDNVAHYLLGKYLWHVCNKKKDGFWDPVYSTGIREEVSLSFVFFEQQPQHLYFKKPEWIDEFLVARDEKEINKIAREYDYFVNQYRYRGCQPPETNCGYSEELKELNLSVPPITYKSVFEEKLYIDDLELNEQYTRFLDEIRKEIAPNGAPFIVLHNRGNDPWNRHVLFAIAKYEQVLENLLKRFPNHIFVLVGEAWKQYQHPRVKLLGSFINETRCLQKLMEYNQCLQYVLSAYFCKEADLVFIGISGFTLFIESIRSLSKSPPIPVLWDPEVFEGECTCVKLMKKEKGWYCKEFEEYKAKNPHDLPYQYGIHHFLYYSRDEALLKPYCFDNPNTPSKVIQFAEKMAHAWNIPVCISSQKEPVSHIIWSRYCHYIYCSVFYVLRFLYKKTPLSLRSRVRQKVLLFLKNRAMSSSSQQS